tara:strand:- start:317 stop:535 length:219 start_codon:yes stop_codon:yes gene_type:complete
MTTLTIMYFIPSSIFLCYIGERIKNKIKEYRNNNLTDIMVEPLNTEVLNITRASPLVPYDNVIIDINNNVVI